MEVGAEAGATSPIARLRGFLLPVLSVFLGVFCVFEVNFTRLTPLAGLSVFALLGLTISFLAFPLAKRWSTNRVLGILDFVLVLVAVGCCGYVLIQGKALGQRAGAYTPMDIAVGVGGILTVLEATRRSIGWALPLIAGLFLAYALFGPSLPDWLFPHRGYAVDRIVAQTFLRSEGVFGTALRVMFTYVFLFVIFGALLEATGATQFIMDMAYRFFGKSTGGPAKVAVLSSGLLGSLSGSAVANAVTSGTFTIPMMRSSGFSRQAAGGIEAAASSGGALVPPVMGAGAYMMIEIIDPPVTYLQIIKAALIPAGLYYLSIFMIVHFYSRRVGATRAETETREVRPLLQVEGLIFCGSLAVLGGFLVAGFTPYRSVTCALVALVVLSFFHPRTRLTPRRMFDALLKSARNGVPLVAASACVGIVIGVVTLTGVGTAFPNAVLPLAKQSLTLALVAIMLCSIVLGMGLPSAVCYLLMATLIGPVLNRLGVPILAAHLFIFYFGLMSMVTPPVALAAYATASIAGSNIMRTGLAAFRFSFVGFTLPFMFIYRPQLLLIAQEGESLSVVAVLIAITVAVSGIFAFAAAIAGFLFTVLSWRFRGLLLLASGLLLFPDSTRLGGLDLGPIDLAGALLFGVILVLNWRARVMPAVA